MFFLGTHEPSWLAHLGVPLFVSRVRLARLRQWPRAAAPWAMDSGGYSALSRPPHRWPLTVRQYAEEVARAAHEVGLLAWAAPMDSTCDPEALAGTGRTVAYHQAETVERYLQLRQLVDVPVPPVLQGATEADYWHCADLYAGAGVDLLAAPVVGLGSVCGTQQTRATAQLVRGLAATGMRLHGFGVKAEGLALYGRLLASADSMVWSRLARLEGPLPGCSHGRTGAGLCNNCPRYALAWRARLLADLAGSHAQLGLALQPLADVH